MKKFIFSTLVVLSCIGTANAAVNCKVIEERADRDGAQYHPRLRKKVIKSGRLYFHTAPHPDCKDPNVFIIKNDHVTTYTNYNGYDYIMYMSKSGEPFSGWVKSNALTTSGTMGPSN